MYRVKLFVLTFLVAGASATIVSSAPAQTLGSTAAPAGSTAGGCGANGFYSQSVSDPGTAYAVPAAGGQLTSWSVNTNSASAGAPVTLVVLHANGGGYTVVGSDTKALPNPLPGGGVASFPISPPMPVSGGDFIGLVPGGSMACYFFGGATPGAGVLTVGMANATTPGTIYTPTATAAGYRVGVSAELTQSQDTSVTATTAPGTITAGGSAAYSFTVTNHGPASAPITFTSAVPGGLTVLLAVAGSGTCTVAAQQVTCTLPSLAAGTSAPVAIVVQAASAGSYAATATVSSAQPDLNPADNATSATLVVDPAAPPSTITTTVTTQAPPGPPAPPVCRTIALKGATLTLAKKAIVALNCKVGKISKATSRSVKKGLVVSTSPGSGKTLANGTVVKITQSSGPPKKKGKKSKT